MKHIILSFDDGREDFYTNALPILKKYGLNATLNVITDCVDSDGFISWKEIEACKDYGIEIANHSANHTNEIESIKKAARSLEKHLGKGCYGFASPSSEIYAKNVDKYLPLLKDGTVAYIRSGRQIKRDGIFHAALYIAAMKTKSNLLYRLLNNRNTIHTPPRLSENSSDRLESEVKTQGDCLKNSSGGHSRRSKFSDDFLGSSFWTVCPPQQSKNLVITDSIDNRYSLTFYPSVTCNADNNGKQLISFLNTMADGNTAIIMFHSILSSNCNNGKNRWFNSIKEFDEICNYLATDKEIAVITNKNFNTIFGLEEELYV